MLKVSGGDFFFEEMLWSDPTTLWPKLAGAAKVGTSSHYFQAGAQFGRDLVVVAASPTPCPEKPFWEKMLDSGKINVQIGSWYRAGELDEVTLIVVALLAGNPRLEELQRKTSAKTPPTIKISRSREALVWREVARLIVIARNPLSESLLSRGFPFKLLCLEIHILFDLFRLVLYVWLP